MVSLLCISCTFWLSQSSFVVGFVFGLAAFASWFVLAVLLVANLLVERKDKTDVRIFPSLGKGLIMICSKYLLPYFLLMLGFRSGGSMVGLVTGLVCGLAVSSVSGWLAR